MNKEQQELLDEAYENYRKEINRRLSIPLLELTDKDSITEGDMHESTSLNDFSRIWTQEEFINKCKTDQEFSERWGLKIEERELSLEERAKLLSNSIGLEIKETSLHEPGQFEMEVTKDSNALDIPTKLITITYNNKTIESYE